MKILRIGYDFDGVIVNTSYLKSIIVRVLYKRIIPGEMIKEELLHEIGLTLTQYRLIQKIAYGTKVGLNVQIMPGILECIAKLNNEGHHQCIITSRFDHSLEIAKQICANKKIELNITGTGFQKSKAEAAQNLDVFYDDSLRKLIALKGIVQKLFLQDWSYNRNVSEAKIATRVSSADNFYEEIQKLK